MFSPAVHALDVCSKLHLASWFLYCQLTYTSIMEELASELHAAFAWASGQAIRCMVEEQILGVLQ